MDSTSENSASPTVAPSNLLSRLGSIGDGPSDTNDEKLKHRFLVYMAILMSGGGLVWGGLATYYGMLLPAVIPFGYTVCTALNLTYFRLSKNFTFVRFIQVLLSLVLPFIFQWTLGGFGASGAVMLWAMLSIVGALTFTEGRTIVKWLVLYSVLTITSGIVDPFVIERFSHGAGPNALTLFYVVNIVLISNVTFGLMLYFIAQRQRAEQALRSANEHIEDLEEEVRSAKKLGQYTLDSRLGQGGMGEVYRASHAMLRRPTAIKLLPSDKVGEQSIRRFEQEVQLTAQLTHPNTITVFDYGRTPDGVFYYAMELLEGASVEDVVRAGGPQDVGRVVRVLRQAADALSEAHGAGLIHRDIKPANLVLCRYGGKYDHLKVLDFGLVRAIQRSDAEGITRDGMVAGTPSYLAPEALTDPENLDHRSDVYSLGAVGFFMLTGETLFTGKTIAEICGHHIHTAPDTPSARLGRPIPAALESVIMQCLEKNPSKRPASAAAVVEALDACSDCASWTQRQAKEWWQTLGTGLRPKEPERSKHDKTIDIDLSRRAPEATKDLRHP